MNNFMNEPNPMMSSSVKGAKTFEASIIDEIIEELKEDAETFVLQKCKSRYKEVVNMGYFKVEKGLEKGEGKPQEKDKMTDF
jgi:dipeptidase